MMTGDMIMAVLRALSWSETNDFDALVKNGIVKVIMAVLKEAESTYSANMSNRSVRMDCANGMSKFISELRR